MTPAWIFRRAGVADLEAVMALETGIFVRDAWSERAMAAELASPHTYYLVAAPDGHPDAVAAYAGLLAPAGSGEADVQTIAVAEEARGRGIGRTLMRSLIAEARRRGARNVFLEVRADNPVARGLYRSLGFEETGLRRGYYQPDGVDAITMRLAVPAARTMPAVGAETADTDESTRRRA